MLLKELSSICFRPVFPQIYFMPAIAREKSSTGKYTAVYDQVKTVEKSQVSCQTTWSAAGT